MRFKSVRDAAVVLGLTLGGILVLEGVENKAYTDVGGVPTICAGETRGVKLGDYMTDAQCFSMTEKAAVEWTGLLYKHVKVPLPAETESALVWFLYNVGETQFYNSTMLRLINAGELEAACNELDRWVYVQGRVVPGLVNRRAVEKEYCLYGIQSETPVDSVVGDSVPVRNDRNLFCRLLSWTGFCKD